MFSTKDRTEELGRKFKQLEAKNINRRVSFNKEFEDSKESYQLQKNRVSKRLKQFEINRSK